MVSSEQELVSVEEHHVAPGVTRYRNGEKILVQRRSFAPVQQTFCSNRAAVGAVDDAWAAEVLMEFLVIGNVVLVCE